MKGVATCYVHGRRSSTLVCEVLSLDNEFLAHNFLSVAEITLQVYYYYNWPQCVCDSTEDMVLHRNNL